MTGEMTDLHLLTEAANQIRKGHEFTDIQRLMVADILEGEASIRGNMAGFVDLLNIAFDQTGGGKADLQLVRHEETGEIQIFGNNVTNTVRLSRDILLAQEAQ